MFGEEGDYLFLAMELLGNSIEDEFESCGRIQRHDVNFQIAAQMRIQTVHKNYFVHRDVKPQNFCFGNANPNIVYMIDFGLSKRYVNITTKQHVPYKENRNLTGTPRYASINAHRGIEQSRRDDLESLGYVVVYLLKGSLPWKSVTGANRELKNQRILHIKECINVKVLCEGLPLSMIEYFNVVKAMQFEDTPDYNKLLRLISNNATQTDITTRISEEKDEIHYQEENGASQSTSNNGVSKGSLNAVLDKASMENKLSEIWELTKKKKTQSGFIKIDDDIPGEHDQTIMHLPTVSTYIKESTIMKVAPKK